MKKKLFFLLWIFLLPLSVTAEEKLICLLPYQEHLLSIINHQELRCLAPEHEHSMAILQQQYEEILGGAVYDNQLYLLIGMLEKENQNVTYEVWSYAPDASMTSGKIVAQTQVAHLTSDLIFKITKMVATSDALWMLTRNEETGILGESTLYKISLADGSLSEVLTGPYFHMCTDGEKLYFDRYDEIYLDFSLVSLDIRRNTPKEKKLLTYDHPSFGYPICDPNSGDIIFLSGTDIVQLDNKKTIFLSYRGTSNWTSRDETWFWNNQLVKVAYLASPEDVVMIPLANHEETIVVTVNHSSFNSLVFNKEYPNIRFRFVEVFDDLPTRMQTRNPEPTIFVGQGLKAGFNAMLKNNYAIPLDDCPEITRTFDASYSALLSLMTNTKGQICAVPYGIYSTYAYTYHPDVLHAAGFTEEDLPSTMDEMVQFIQRWATEVDDDTLKLFEQGYNDTAWGNLLETAIAIPLLTAQRDGEAVSLSSNPTLKNDFIWLVENKDLIESLTRYDSEDALFVWDSNSSITNKGNYTEAEYGFDKLDTRILLLRADDEHAPILPVFMNLYIVNPYAPEKNIAAAKTYLSWYATHLEPWLYTILSPDHNDPIPYADLEKDIDLCLLAIEDSQSRLDTYRNNPEWFRINTDVNERDLLDAIKQDEDHLVWLQDHPYTITPDSIQPYREAAAYMYAVAESWRESTSVKTLYNQLLEGKIPPAQFLQRLEQILIMQAMEDGR